METGDEREDQLYIFENVPERKDIFPGYTAREVTIIGVCTLVALVVILFNIFLWFNAVIFFLAALMVVGPFLSLRLNSASENFYDIIRIMRKHRKSQKVYYYQYYDSIKEVSLDANQRK